MKSKKTRLLVALSTAFLTTGPLLTAVPTLSWAEDIDIYAANTGSGAHPNVIIVLDNSSNWSSAAQQWAGGITQGQAEIKALREVIEGVGSDVNIGLMMFTEGSGSAKDGGYVRYHLRQMTETHKSNLRDLLGNPEACANAKNADSSDSYNCMYQHYQTGENSPKIDAEKVGSAKTDYSAMMYEVYQYFKGGARYAGNPDTRGDPSAYSDGTAKSTYGGLLSDDTKCASNYVIFIGNGFPAQDAPSSLLTAVGGDATEMKLPEYTTKTKVQTYALESTACGSYADASSCTSAKQTQFGATYGSVTCTEDSSNACPAGSSQTVTTLLNSATSCSAYSSLEACNTDTANKYSGGYCVQGDACTYTESIGSSVTVTEQTACLSGTKNKPSDCVAWAQNSTYASQYANFSCSNMVTTGCSGSAAKWKITATDYVRSSHHFATYQSTTTVVPGGKSFNVTGTLAATSAVATGNYINTSHPRGADEWSKFLANTGVPAPSGTKQTITTYTIDVFNAQQDVEQTMLLRSMANNGNGKYFQAKTLADIKTALQKIMAEIQSVNSVFASSSLPVSVNTQGTYLNQVFIGMFRPNVDASPRWPGNLKQYKLKYFASDLKLSDKNGKEAISSTTGFITPCATSMWTTSTGEYWKYPGTKAIGTCNTDTSSTYSDSPDGDVVEKGGAGQRLRGVTTSNSTYATSTNYSSRNLYTCTVAADKSCGTTLTEFKTSNTGDVTAAALGVADRDDLINWVRGQDVDDENQNGLTGEMRPSVHGGVVHSQPAVVDYGSSSYGVVAFYGADDGVLHAVDGGTTDTEGVELWGFIAPETFGRLSRLRSNYPLISFPGIEDDTVAPKPKDYFFDGSFAVYQKSSPSKVWLFPTMRRGGRAVYAFDVTNPTSPSLKWRNGCFTSSTNDDTACTSGWSALGQTWSKPQVTYINGYEDASHNPKPVLVFGGGYDTCEDADPVTSCDSPKGAGIWFVDADTGTVLATYPTLRSVPGDVTVLADISTENATYVYATDTGANVYRIKVGSYDAASASPLVDWSATTVAATQIGAFAGTNDIKRKFLYGPDATIYRGYNVVTFGTGDREHPLVDSSACQKGLTNRFYMLKDVTSDAVSVAGDADLLDVTSLTNVKTSDLAAYKGWYFDLNACEQVVNKPLIFAGSINFGTNQAQTTGEACGRNLGVARGYKVNFLTGNADGDSRSTVYNGGGLPPSPVGGVVDIAPGDQSDEGEGGDGKDKLVPIILGGGDKKSSLEGESVDISPPSNRFKTYWYKETD